MMVLSYVLAPKPKAPKPDGVKQLEDPTAEAGKEMCVIFGTVTQKDPNVLWFGEKGVKTYQVKA